ncbi:MAG: isochorismatase family protein [Nitrososphaerota archaeon]|nr:isochorismatase family protein [Nitrososphaerota archaeon]
MKASLIVVDVQRDFCPGGSLAVKDGDRVVAPLNNAISAFHGAGLPIFFTRDWHPENHCSFKEQGGPWPRHCVAGSPGAEFHPALGLPSGAIVISKATDPKVEAYSGFQGTRLDAELRRLGVGELFVGGLATDYCVKQTCLDGLEKGYHVSVLTDCVRGVDLRPRDSEEALRIVTSRGAKLSASTEAMEMCRRAAMMSSSRP